MMMMMMMMMMRPWKSLGKSLAILITYKRYITGRSSCRNQTSALKKTLKARHRASKKKAKAQYGSIRLMLESEQPLEEVNLSEVLQLEKDLRRMALSEKARSRNWFNKRPMIKASLACLNNFFNKMTADDIKVLIINLHEINDPSTPVMHQINMIKEHYSNLLENAAFNVSFHAYVMKKFPRRVKIYKMIETRYPKNYT